MIVIRPVQQEDLGAVYQLALKTGLGMTSLPADTGILSDKIQNSVNSFSIEPTKVGGEAYTFIIEEFTNPEQELGHICGIASIRAKVGGYKPFYSYQILEAEHKSEALNINKKIPFLQLCTEFDGPSIISSLFIEPEYRSKGYGKVLSLSRFCFMASHSHRFEDRVIAEMRGYIDTEHNKSAFWENVVRPFFDLEFERADYLSLTDKGFIADLMPKYPIYIPLLNQEVQNTIAQVHEETKPALKFLEAQGFERDGHVDIFDAGPRLSCDIKDIKCIKESKIASIFKVDTTAPETEGKANTLVTNTNIDFRATVVNSQAFQEVKVAGKDLAIVINKSLADKLKVKAGDNLRLVPL